MPTVEPRSIPRFVPAILLACLALGIASCALFKAGKGLKACRYTFQNMAFSSLDKDRSYWTVDVGVVNPNPHPVTLEKMRFAFLRLDDTLVTGWNPSRRELAPAESVSLRTSLEIPHAVIQRLPPGLLADPAAEFTLTGDAYLKTWVGEVHVRDAVRRTIKVNMPEQVAKVRNLFLQRLFPGFLRPAPGQAQPESVPAYPRPSPKDEPL